MKKFNANEKNEWIQVRNKFLGDKAVIEAIHGKQMTICRYKICDVINIPPHLHDYEQTIYVLEGEMNLNIDGNKVYMKEGDAVVILGNVEHSAEIFGVPFRSFETYSPPRHDLIEK